LYGPPVYKEAIVIPCFVSSKSLTLAQTGKDNSMFSTMTRQVVQFVRNEDGPTAVEYAVMLALIIVVCIGAITTLGSNANVTFTSVGSAISASS
jgi:pilus assembly protein Flp/PilA